MNMSLMQFSARLARPFAWSVRSKATRVARQESPQRKEADGAETKRAQRQDLSGEVDGFRSTRMHPDLSDEENVNNIRKFFKERKEHDQSRRQQTLSSYLRNKNAAKEDTSSTPNTTHHEKQEGRK